MSIIAFLGPMSPCREPLNLSVVLEIPDIRTLTWDNNKNIK